MPGYHLYKTVKAFLEQSGYRRVRKRPYPDRKQTWFVLFEHWSKRKPWIGFPVAQRKVLGEHFERIKLLVELHSEEE